MLKEYKCSSYVWKHIREHEYDEERNEKIWKDLHGIFRVEKCNTWNSKFISKLLTAEEKTY